MDEARAGMQPLTDHRLPFVHYLVDQMGGLRNNQIMIPVGKIGKITNGEDIGKFVRVDDGERLYTKMRR